MKYFVISLIILGILSTPAFAELTSDDLLKISEIVKASETEMKAEIKDIKTEMKAEIKASETRMKEYVDIKIESVNKQLGQIDKRITDTKNLTYVLIALIGAVVGIPLWRDRKDRKLEKQLEKQVEALTHEVETLKKQIAAL